MIAVVDAGNSTINFGIIDRGKVIYRAFYPTNPVKEGKKLEFRSQFKPEGAIFSSVVPEISDKIEGALRKLTGTAPLELSYRNAPGIRILYKNPAELGSDRVTHAYFVKKFVKSPSVVVDIGTAITIDFIGDDGTFAGGAILASPETVLHGLATRTSKLKEIDLKDWPAGFIGTSTSECLRIGLLHGTVGAILYITQEIENSLETEARKFLTGGGGILFREKLVDFHYNPDLNLLGLYAAYEEISKERQNERP